MVHWLQAHATGKEARDGADELRDALRDITAQAQAAHLAFEALLGTVGKAAALRPLRTIDNALAAIRERLGST